MGTLLTLLDKPFFDAIRATHFGAVRAHNGVLDFIQTYKALEDLFQVLSGGGASRLRQGGLLLLQIWSMDMEGLFDLFLVIFF